ncbi:MAG: FtsX-like permease family protein [Planctomycetota bacterium]
MRTIWLLTTSQFGGHKVRTALTTLATASAVCLLIWVISIYSSAIRSLDVYASRALGRYTLVVDPISRKANREVLPATVDLLRAQPKVQSVDPMWARLLTFRLVGRHLGGGGDAGGGYRDREGGWEDVVIGTDAAAPPFEMLRGDWIADDRSEAVEVVLSKAFADQLGVDIGDQLEVPGPTPRRLRLSIVGVMKPPPPTITGATVGSRMLPSPSVGAVFCSLRDARSVHRVPSTITFVAVELHDDVDVHRFRYRLSPQLHAMPKPAQFMTDLDLEEEMSEAAKASSLALQASVVGVIAVLLAFLVILSTLSMGVSERTRQFAILRAVVLSKRQLAVLIASEGIALACLGLLVGIPLGSALVVAFDRATDGVVRHGIGVDRWGIMLAILVSLIASVLAAAIPAWRATRVKPLDAVLPRNALLAGDRRGLSIASLLICIPLLVCFPAISFWSPPSLAESVFARLLFGAASLGLGLLLLTPGLVRAFDSWLSPWLAWLLRLPPELLRQQLTSQLWRTTACALTMSVGMGLFSGIHVWGWSMVQIFVPTDWAPDATLVFDRPLSQQDLDQLRSRFSDGKIEPLIVEQPRLRDDVLDSAEYPSVTRQMVVVLAGIDPEVAFGSETPLVDARWCAGSPQEAIRLMKTARGCVVPDHFLKQSELEIGGDLYLIPPETPEHPVRYTIAGAVHLRGGQWMTKTTNMRQRTHRSAGLLFADFDSVKRDFELPGPLHCWVNAAGVNEDANAALDVAKSLIENPADAVNPSPDGVRLMMTSDIGGHVLQSAAFWLWFMSVVPVMAMGISSIAMVNMLLAAVRARQWEFGILRAVGYTRSTLVRIVVAEGILIGLVACTIGCSFGIMAGWCGTALTQATSWFGGMDVPLTLPAVPLMVGCAVMLVFASLAATWPALRIGFSSPLTLLARGRGTE